MIEYLEILLIAVVQGIAEFLPISSSGHLVVVNRLFECFGVPLAGTEADFVKLNVLLHVGTLIAVLIVFRRRIAALFGKDLKLIPLLLVGTLPVVVVGFGVKENALWITKDLFITASCFLATALLLLVSLRYFQGTRTGADMTVADALFIGVFQAVAILPGLSRSGATIVAGLFRKLDREEAATFSFLLSIPIIALSGTVQVYEMHRQPIGEGTLSPALLLTGMLVSCLVGVVALVWLLDWLKKGKLWYFALWLLVMSPLTFLTAVLPTNALTTRSVSESARESKKDDTVPAAPVSPESPTESSRDSSAEEKQPLSRPGSELPYGLEPTKTTEQDDEIQGDRNSLIRAIDETTSDRLNMSREEALKEYEKILADEEAKERAMIEEERKRIPFVEEPDKLIPVDPVDRIWITPDQKSVVLLGRVALREGLLELFACRIGTKEHEAVVSLRVKPYMIHFALLAVGAEPGKPVQVVPKFVPAGGDEIDILVRWKDEHGEIRELPAQDWVLDERATRQATEDGKPEKIAMKSNWVFSGSMTYKDESGQTHYIADETGELFGLSNFVGSILDVPFQSSADNAELLFTCFTERIPELDAPITLILTPVKNKKR